MGEGMVGRVALVLALSGSGCLGPDVVRCGDHICPAGRVCAPGNDGCVFQAQLDACRADAGEGADCTFTGVAGICIEGVCVAPACGDGVASPPEECDGEDLG